MKLETRLLWRFIGGHSVLTVEELIDQDVYIITKRINIDGEWTNYYKGLEAANKVYIELREKMMKDESEYIDAEDMEDEQ